MSHIPSCCYNTELFHALLCHELNGLGFFHHIWRQIVRRLVTPEVASQPAFGYFIKYSSSQIYNDVVMLYQQIQTCSCEFLCLQRTWLKMSSKFVIAGLGSFPAFPHEVPSLDCKHSTTYNMQDTYSQLSSASIHIIEFFFGLDLEC